MDWVGAQLGRLCNWKVIHHFFLSPSERSKNWTVKVLTAEYSRGTFRSQLVRNGSALAVVPCDNDNNQINDQFAAAPLSSPVLFLAFNNEKLGVEPLHSVRDLTFISEERGRQEI